jgi:uroporphyrinogen-III synthase
MATLIRKQGGEPVLAPSMREVPLEHEESALDFGRGLLAGEFDAAVFLTGVGTRLLWKVLSSKFAEADLRQALSRLLLVVRGPKPSLALRELGLTPGLLVPEPNTWRELLEAIRSRPEHRLAVQEYGASNTELIEGLRLQGRKVTQVQIYGWAMPEDTEPLRGAARELAGGTIDVALFTTSTQVVHLMKVAEDQAIASEVRNGMLRAFVGSIGPTTSETLQSYGLKADFEPSHPKMGLLVNEAAAKFPLARGES